MSRFMHLKGATRQDLTEANANQAEGSMVIATIERSSTAAMSLFSFLKCTEFILDHTDQSHRPHGIYMHAVGLHAAGRSSLYDLYWLRFTPGWIYAFDIRDDTYVCVKPFGTIEYRRQKRQQQQPNIIYSLPTSLLGKDLVFVPLKD